MQSEAQSVPHFFFDLALHKVYIKANSCKKKKKNLKELEPLDNEDLLHSL